MKLVDNPAINDTIRPDYQIYWINPLSSEEGKCTFFTYGGGEKIAIAIFQILYPGCSINRMIKIKNN